MDYTKARRIADKYDIDILSASCYVNCHSNDKACGDCSRCQYMECSGSCGNKELCDDIYKREALNPDAGDEERG